MQTSLDKMRKASKETRGAVLEAVTDFEWVIDIYIANYFTGKDDSKFNDFVSLIITPYVTFRNKADTFRILVNKLHPEFGEKYPKFKKHFNDIAEQRNALAHYPLYTQDSAINHFEQENELEYLKFKPLSFEGKTELLSKLPFKDKDVNDLTKLITSYTDAILDLLEMGKARP